MKVSDYVKEGLKNRVEQKPEGYELLGAYKEGVHSVECYAKLEDGKIVDAKYVSSKRCKKLMAVADLICERLKGQKIDNIKIDKDDILTFFREEKEKDKMENRVSIVLKALKVNV